MTFIIIGLLLSACNQAGDQDSLTHADDEQAAVQIAETWLALIDEGKYEESWNESSSMFKNSVTKEQWIETMKINRPQFGKVLQRDVKTKSYETNISGKPDLEHVDQGKLMSIKLDPIQAQLTNCRANADQI